MENASYSLLGTLMNLSVLVLHKRIVRLYILTSEGQYLEIGEKANKIGEKFEWKFKKEKYFFSFKVATKDYVTFLSCNCLSPDQMHFKPKEKVLKKINLATDLILKPSNH